MADEFVSNVWSKGLFGKHVLQLKLPTLTHLPAGKVVFCTGGSGDICSAQVKALVYLGANAFIVGRNAEKARRVAQEIANVRSGSKVLSRGVDVRDLENLATAAEDCAQKLGGIDFVM